MTCCFLIPIQKGESWTVDNCTTAICTNGKVIKTPKPCPTVQQPICANGRKVVKGYDDNGCCPHYECECVCSVWGGSTYNTFDGKSYRFNKDCSYYLVKEIITKYNLTITLNKHDCDPSDNTFCTQALTVTYQSYEVVLTRRLKTSGTEANAVYVNQKRIYPAYSNSVMHIIGTDMIILLIIPEIKTKVTYRGSTFSIDIPNSLFGGNTEGQCGTCDNSQNNDCRSPNGQVEKCTESAGQWRVPDIPCVTPTTPPTMTTTMTPQTASTPPQSTTQSVCKPAICDLLTSSVFAPCHSVIAPGQFVQSCVNDICNGGNDSCSSLEAYASECSNAGVCIDWRNDTNGQCEHKCPSGKVYMACGPAVERTCNERYNKKFKIDASTNYTEEGCFCPEGTTLFNTVYETCVKSCDCVGPNGQPKQPGETWTSDCSNCVCDKDSMSVQCQPIECPSVQSPNCSEPGQQLVNKTDDCCTTQSCECNTNLCPTPPTCKLGFYLTVTNDTCCQSYKCEPKGVCVHDMTEYKGYEYQTVPGKCCGKCVQKSCIFTTPDNTTQIIEVNDTFVPPNNKCVKYTCEKINGQLVTKETETTCPHFNPLDCEPGTETTDANGCCKTCKQRSVCEVQSNETVIEVNGCKSVQPVNMTSCAGHCGSSSIYSAAANKMMHQCECCQEATTSQKQVELTCADNSKVQHTYTVVETCSCRKTECVEGTTAKLQRRRRR
ncbi:mucin-2-like [Scomber japonicus]|uniref:mucin-2-like n=1 Tax=Scomber japonicus TaxID=13676 RepID=UPI002305D0D4|nr:mucin-2-like [Scomber japonicus]